MNTKLQDVSIVDKNGTLIFNQNKDNNKSVVNKEEVQVMEYTDETLRLQLRNVEAKAKDISISAADNPYSCPAALWNKLSGIQKLKYNEGMDCLLQSGDIYYTVQGKPASPEVVAHNAMILLSKML